MRQRMAALIAAAFLFSVAAPSAFPQEPFYKNKAIRIVVGYAAGGGFGTPIPEPSPATWASTFRGTLPWLSTT